MDGFKINMLCKDLHKDESFSKFEAINILNIESDKVMDLDSINVYRGLNYMGISIKENLICLDSNGLNKRFIKFDADVHMLSNSSDGRFLLILLKNKYIYLIYVPTKRTIYKKAIEISEFDSVNCALILTVNDNVSEIWIFLSKSVFIYRRLNLVGIEEAISLGEENEKVKLFSQIKIEQNVFPFFRTDEQLIVIKILKCKRDDQFIMAILYSASLIVLHGHFENNVSHIDCINETDLSNFDVSVKCNTKCMEISPDESHVFILDEMGVLWICNFIMGCISGILNANDGSYVDVVLSSGLIVVKKKSIGNNISLDILSFPSLEIIENFDISMNSVLFPMIQTDEPIIIMDMADNNSQNIILKSIRKLDANIRLKEIIDTGNFEYAFKFAEIFKLDKEDIYVHLLKYLLDLSKDSQSLSEGECALILQCLKEIKNFFDVEVFERLLLNVIMPSTILHENFLIVLHFKTITTSNDVEKATLFDKIKNEMHTFEIFKRFCYKPEYSIKNWKDFRYMDSLQILYLIISIDYVDLLFKLWDKIKDKVDSLFKCNDRFFDKTLTLIQNMIAQSWNASKLKKFLVWFVLQILRQQVVVCPSRLLIVTNMFENIIKVIEATKDKEYRKTCIYVLTMADKLLKYICNKASTPLEKALAESAGLMSFSEPYNPALSLTKLKTELMQLDRLHQTYNLDLSLALLKDESKIDLASRLLDHISTNDLYNNKVLPKLKYFLKEFNLGTCEFFYSYIKRLIIHITLVIDDDIESRFIILLNHVSERQLRLELIIEYASKAEVPFKDKLRQLIEKEISTNSVNNSAVRRLQTLQRKSNLSPLLNRYGIHYDSDKTLLVRKLLRRILRKEVFSPGNEINDDIKQLMNEYKIDDLVVIKAKCDVYVNNIIFNDDLAASNSLTKLRLIINCETYPHTMKNVIVEHSFENFISHFQMDVKMSFYKLQFILEVARWIVSKIYNEDEALHWKETFDILLSCSTLRFDPSNESISFSELICQNDVSSLYLPHCRYQLIKKCIEIKVTKVINKVNTADNYNQKEVLQNFEDIEIFCLQSSEDIEQLLLEIYKDCFYKTINDTITEDPYLGCCLLYSYFNILYKWRINDRIKFQSCFDLSVLSCLNNIDLSNNVYLLWNIMKTLTKLISLYVYKDIWYLYKDFIILYRIINFLTNITRIYAELESPSNFESIKLNNVYQEVPRSFDTIRGITQLIKSGINVISSKNKDTFQGCVENFADQSAKFVSYFWSEGLALLGCLALTDILSISLGYITKDVTMFSSLFEVNLKKDYLCHLVDNVMKMTKIDTLFATSILLLLPRDSILRKVKLVMQKCKTSKKMLDVCAVTLEVLVMNKELFSMEEIIEFSNNILIEARKHYWANILKPYQISMFKSADKSRIKLKCLEMLNNVNVPVDLVEDFVTDFEIYSYKSNLKLFRDVFKTNFNDCNTLYSYQIKVESLLQRAEELWTSIPSYDKDYNLVSICFTKIIDWTSPYHYEILEYVYERLHSVSFCNEHEPKVIALLYKWTRTSPVGEVERQFCEIHYVKEGLPNPLNATYLVLTRLPYNLVVGLDTMAVLEQELHSTNVNLWINLYTLLFKIGGPNHMVFNPDLLQLQAVENLFSDFIKYSKVPDINNDNTPLFLGNLYEVSSVWFKETIELGMTFLQRLIVNSSYIEIIKKMLNQLSVGEQRIHLINVALSWIDCQLSIKPCISSVALIKWRKENIILKQRLEVEKVLFENNLYNDQYLDLIPSFMIMLENILNVESLVPIIKYDVRENIVAAIKSIAHITAIDLHEFIFTLLVSTLKLQTRDYLDVSRDQDMSLLNMSVDSTSDSKPTSEVNYDICTQRMELLSCDSEIQRIIKINLSSYLNNNGLNSQQWLYVFIYLLRSSQHCNDVHDITCLNNVHKFRLLLLVIELQSLDAEIITFGEFTFISLLEYLDTFVREDKTYLVKRLYRGDNNNRKSHYKPSETIDSKLCYVLKDLMELCHVDINDEVIIELSSKL